MGFDPEDQEIIRLLTKIKDAEGEYPEHMLVTRRRSYLKRMEEISLGIPADMGAKDPVKPSAASTATSTLVETVLVIAIIAEASTVAYFYRDQLADFFRRTAGEPRVQEVTSPSVVPTSFEIQGITPSSAVNLATSPSATIWSPATPAGNVVVPTGTPVPGTIPGVVNNNGITTTSTGEVNLLNATPGPNDSSGNNGNNGNHYGQTPKPERTKENGNNPPPKDDNEKPPKDNNDKPPKEDKPPKDDNNKPPKDDKPPKNK